MKKFLVLFNAPVAAMAEMMKNSTPEQMKAGMEEWKHWMDGHKESFADMGAPLGKNLRVTANGAEQVSNEVGGYSVIQAESQEAVAKLLAGMPHFEIPGAYIEIMPLGDMGKM